MRLKLPTTWEKPLKTYLHSETHYILSDFVQDVYQEKLCYPAFEDIFKAFVYCSFKSVKVVILGQDPYHGPGQAHGLSFSVPQNVPIPPSLKNILKELKNDLGMDSSANGNLTPWAHQGVFLLNSILSVTANEAGSHQKKGWETLTDTVIQTLSEKKEGVVFMLWGGFAQKKKRLIDPSKHLILSAGHPSPLSANRGFWFGNKHFSQCNNYLIKNGQSPIDWSL